MPYPRKVVLEELGVAADSISMLLRVSRDYLTEDEKQALNARLRPYFDGIAGILRESAVEHRELIEAYEGEDPRDRIDRLVEIEMAELLSALLP